MKPSNFLVIMSDEHNPKILGCAGHSSIKTPVLDNLAAKGTRFSAAYTPSPICVPARASFATGQYVHKIRYWDNALAYDGVVPSWGHRLMETGHRSVSIGKLHYRNDKDPTGFHEEIVPLNVVDGLGDLLGMVRTPPPQRYRARKQVEDAGMGESSYTEYDREITRRSVQWLKEEAPKYTDQPWVLFVSLVCPHFPLIAPEPFYKLYSDSDIPAPIQYEPTVPPPHPAIEERWRLSGYSQGFSDEQIKVATMAYYGMVSFLDDNIGQILGTLEDCGLVDSTRILYTSDHGDNLGRNGLWGKSTMFEDSVGIPLIVSGEGVPQGKTVSTPANLVDVFPTVLECVGEPRAPEDTNLPGVSLWAMADGAVPERVQLSEYHASGSSGGNYMIRNGRFKYIFYVNFPPQLFDLEADPNEKRNLAAEPAHATTLAECEALLRGVVNPEAADKVAKNDQWQRIQDMGGPENLLKRGTFGYTPAPGETPVFT